MFNEYFITSFLELSKPLELLLTPSAAIVGAMAAGPTGGPQPTLVEVLDFECVNEGKVNKVITSPPTREQRTHGVLIRCY